MKDEQPTHPQATPRGEGNHQVRAEGAADPQGTFGTHRQHPIIATEGAGQVSVEERERADEERVYRCAKGHLSNVIRPQPEDRPARCFFCPATIVADWIAGPPREASDD